MVHLKPKPEKLNENGIVPISVMDLSHKSLLFVSFEGLIVR